MGECAHFRCFSLLKMLNFFKVLAKGTIPLGGGNRVVITSESVRKMTVSTPDHSFSVIIKIYTRCFYKEQENQAQMAKIFR